MLSQVLRKMGSKDAHGCSHNAENSFGFDIVLQYHKYGKEFLSHIVWVTGDETWVSFVNAETKEPSKQGMHTHSTNKLKKFKQTLSACQKAYGNCFLGHETGADGWIHATRDHNNIINVL
jgi:hypothetical protein